MNGGATRPCTRNRLFHVPDLVFNYDVCDGTPRRDQLKVRSLFSDGYAGKWRWQKYS